MDDVRPFFEDGLLLLWGDRGFFITFLVFGVFPNK
jgi:hypothetical protein